MSLFFFFVFFVFFLCCCNIKLFKVRISHTNTATTPLQSIHTYHMHSQQATNPTPNQQQAAAEIAQHSPVLQEPNSDATTHKSLGIKCIRTHLVNAPELVNIVTKMDSQVLQERIIRQVTLQNTTYVKRRCAFATEMRSQLEI